MIIQPFRESLAVHALIRGRCRAGRTIRRGCASTPELPPAPSVIAGMPSEIGSWNRSTIDRVAASMPSSSRRFDREFQRAVNPLGSRPSVFRRSNRLCSFSSGSPARRVAFSSSTASLIARRKTHPVAAIPLQQQSADPLPSTLHSESS